MKENEIHLYSDDSLSYENERINDRGSEMAKNAIFQIQGKTSFDKLGVKSVMSSSAQFAGLCSSRSYQVLMNTINRLLDQSNNELSTYEKAVIELQFLYGLRITEVLNIVYFDILFNGSITVRGLKGSENRVVYPVKFRDFWIHVHNNKIIFSDSFNRFYFYRLFKKKGIYELISNHKKKSVTHILRYNYIHELIKSGKNIEEIQQIIGHKSIKSTEHYVRGIKQKRRS